VLKELNETKIWLRVIERSQMLKQGWTLSEKTENCASSKMTTEGFPLTNGEMSNEIWKIFFPIQS